MLNNNLPYHIVEEVDGEYYPKVSFESLDEALEFIKFAPAAKLHVLTTEQLEDYIDIDVE